VSLGHFFFAWKVGCKGRNHILLGRKFGEVSLKKYCDNHYGYKQKYPEKPFVAYYWQVAREVRFGQSDKGVLLCRIKHLSKVLVVSDTSCATYQQLNHI
jgi:hypothetical protein